MKIRPVQLNGPYTYLLKQDYLNTDLGTSFSIKYL